MYCTKCGRELPDGVELCPQCDIPIESNEQEPLTTEKTEDNATNTKNDRRPLYFSIVASVILILSMLLPFVSIQFFGTKVDMALIKGDGVIFIGIAVIALLLSFIKKYLGVIVMGVLSVGLSIFEAYNITHTKMDDSDLGFSLDYSSFFHKEIGFYLMFLGSILIIAAGVYGFILKKNGKIYNKQ